MCKIFCGVLMFVLLVIEAEGMGAKTKVTAIVETGPPHIVVSAPPALVMMPQTSIYYVPDVSYDVFFYNGYWWSPRGDLWYRASQYNGPWGVVQRTYVPGPLFKVPKNYRVVYQKERHINYGQWKKQGQNNNKGRGH